MPPRPVIRSDGNAPVEALWPTLAQRGLVGVLRAVAEGERLARAGTPMVEVFVPVDAIVTIARQTRHDPVPLIVALIGYEGIVGGPVLLGAPCWQHDAIVARPGQVVAVRADTLLGLFGSDEPTRTLCLRVIHNHSLQLAQSVVANLGHSVERRVARWLLMIHDRMPGDTVALTHDWLGALLNVRRATVTDALHMLEGQRLLRCSRGQITIRDRAGLEQAAGQSYGFSENDYRDAIGPFGKSSAAEPDQAERP